MSDGDLMAASSEDAFRVVYERHVHAVHRFIVLRVGPDVADDITSTTFTEAWRRRSRFDRASVDARSWLFGIATNVLRRHRKLEAAWQASVAAAAEPQPAIDHLQPTLRDPFIEHALSKLSAGERDILLLHAVADMTVLEAARTLGISTVAAKVRLHRARKKLRADQRFGEVVI